MPGVGTRISFAYSVIHGALQRYVTFLVEIQLSLVSERVLIVSFVDLSGRNWDPHD